MAAHYNHATAIVGRDTIEVCARCLDNTKADVCWKNSTIEEGSSFHMQKFVDLDLWCSLAGQ